MTAEVFTETKDLIDHLTNLAMSKQWVFRGYNKQDELLPSILRSNLCDMERELLFEFERYGAQYITANSPIDFMSCAQHYGLPTRLLDFTYNPFIALFFALFSPKSDDEYENPADKDYYYIRYSDIGSNILLKFAPHMNYELKFEIDSMAQRCAALISTITVLYVDSGQAGLEFQGRDSFISDFFDSIASITGTYDLFSLTKENEEKVHNRTILFIDPNQSNQRLVMQQGLFMFPYTLNRTEHEKILHDNSKEIRIHKSLRDNLLSYLDTIGINTYRIMPDLSNICGAIKRKAQNKLNS